MVVKYFKSFFVIAIFFKTFSFCSSFWIFSRVNYASNNFIKAARQRPELAGVYTTFDDSVPQRYLDVDRTKAKIHNVSITELFATLQINLGSLYVNEFNKYGKVYRVYLQAEEDARSDVDDIGRLKVRNKDGDMIDLNAFVNIEPLVGPYNIPHYDQYKSVAVNGSCGSSYFKILHSISIGF